MRIRRIAATAVLLPVVALVPFVMPPGAAAQEATPTTRYSCEIVATASPMAGMEGMAMGTPAAKGGHDMAGQTVEFDQMYIDMMVPHHASIIAMAQAAQNRLTDERLQSIADTIISAQQAEIEELRDLRERWYGSPESMPMDEGMMGMMAEMMPDMGNMDQMATLMDAAAVVTAFCGADDPDLAFIDLTIPHHKMAIIASEAALEQAVHDEIQPIVARVIEDQQREVDELLEIRQELTGQATPAA
jgi:uncharacterized protein (DUF305 family)